MRIYEILLVLVILTIYSTCGANTRVSDIGSNPYFSYTLYPQDILELPEFSFSYFSRYEKLPYWGDIDEPNNKPNGSNYITTGDEIIDNKSSFMHSANVHSVNNQFGLTRRLRKNLLASFDFNYDINGLSSDAEGNLSDSAEIDEFIPFKYSHQHNINNIYLRGIFGFNIREVPVGLFVRLEYENTFYFNQEFTYSKGEYSGSSNRALWGWSTRGCNHIFGTRQAEGDSYFQREYSQGPLYRFDLQGAATLSKVKFGGLFKFKFGHQEQYLWRSDTTSSSSTGDTILDRNFVGEYVKGNWSKVTRDATIKAYGNINWRKGKRYALNTFISLDYNGRTHGDALSENLDIENDSKEKMRSISLEFNPNINLSLGELFHYIDVALLLKYSYARHNNTYERWIGGGTQETYWNSAVNGENENVWERFSYANENYFDIGVDISTMFPIVNKESGYLGFGFMLLFDTKFTQFTKYYGTNTDNEITNTFNVYNRRENFKREIRFNTVLMLQMLKGPFNVRFELKEPFLYSLMPSTRITDADNNNVSYEHQKQPLWLSQKGFGMGLFFAYELLRK